MIAASPPAIRLANDARQMPGYHHTSSTQYRLHFPRVTVFAEIRKPSAKLPLSLLKEYRCR